MNIDFIEIRRFLHQNPEVSGNEFTTSLFVKDFFEKHCKNADIRNIGDTSLLITFKGISHLKSVLLRCELDALSISEINLFEHRSINEGVSHKCGHDGHMTILLMVGKKLQESPPSGDVHLLFQSAEENGEGAKKVISNGLFHQLCQPDFCFALHNIPGAAVNTILIKKGLITPSVISADLFVTGKTAHAAEPKNGLNPSYLISKFILETEKLQETDSSSKDFKLITPIYTETGSRNFGISAGKSQSGFTLRTLSNHAMNKLRHEFTELAENLSKNYGMNIEINWLEEFSSISNSTICTNFILEAAEELNLNVINKSEAFPWGEDFGLFTEKYQGAMFGLGAGVETPALHNPDYDFPNQILDSGSRMFLKLIELVQK